jgi:hypothetical protein
MPDAEQEGCFLGNSSNRWVSAVLTVAGQAQLGVITAAGWFGPARVPASSVFRALKASSDLVEIGSRNSRIVFHFRSVTIVSLLGHYKIPQFE